MFIVNLPNNNRSHVKRVKVLHVKNAKELTFEKKETEKIFK
jgi:hypothetical protein